MSTHILPSTKLFITLCIFSFLFSTFFLLFWLLFVFPLVNRCQCHALASLAPDSHHTHNSSAACNFRFDWIFIRRLWAAAAAAKMKLLQVNFHFSALRIKLSYSPESSLNAHKGLIKTNTEYSKLRKLGSGDSVAMPCECNFNESN